VPYNAGYRWEGDQLVGVPGSDGRFLDVAVTMEDLGENLTQVANQRRLDLVMTPMEPDIFDPAPYLEQARALTSQTFLLRAYDPFTNQTVAWTPDRDSFTSWLEAGVDSLSLREEDFAEYVDTQTATLSQQNPLLYIEPSDAIEKVRQAITEGRAQVTLRVRYRTSTYTVQPGDSGYRIARRTGVPFFLLQQANPNRDWDVLLSVGETVNLPSRDEVVPLDPVPNKRIIVDLETQTLYAYENGQLVFNWLISSGMDQAPTSPGVYQILSHDDIATGSGVELCGDNSCGSWTMHWFMGIYEIVPGLVNGFHGAVDLPGGRIMGDGNVGRPYTYGCVMSVDGNAEQLYRWADEGTIVEIVSSEYPPQSDLGRLALGQPTQAQNSASSSL
jgi:LysM repeat protein